MTQTADLGWAGAIIRDEIRRVLRRRPDLLKPRYRKAVEAGAHPLTGHCYVASEAARHLLGPLWKPETVRHEGSVHWYLRHRETGEVLDLTAAQFDSPVPYGEGRGRGFLTSAPSKRCREVLAEVGS